MVTTLRGRVSQLVRRETPTGVVQEFWVTGADHSGLVAAPAPAGTGLREGEVVEAEGVLDANGILCAVRVTRPGWLRAPRRWLLTGVPVAAWAAITVVFATAVADTVMTDSGIEIYGDRLRPEACVAWIAAGIALGVFARKLRRPALRVLLQVTAAAVVLAAAGLLVDFDIYESEAAAILVVVSVMAAIVAVVLEIAVRAKKA